MGHGRFASLRKRQLLRKDISKRRALPRLTRIRLVIDATLVR